MVYAISSTGIRKVSQEDTHIDMYRTKCALHSLGLHKSKCVQRSGRQVTTGLLLTLKIIWIHSEIKNHHMTTSKKRIRMVIARKVAVEQLRTMHSWWLRLSPNIVLIVLKSYFLGNMGILQAKPVIASRLLRHSTVTWGDIPLSPHVVEFPIPIGSSIPQEENIVKLYTLLQLLLPNEYIYLKTVPYTVYFSMLHFLQLLSLYIYLYIGDPTKLISIMIWL